MPSLTGWTTSTRSYRPLLIGFYSSYYRSKRKMMSCMDSGATLEFGRPSSSRQPAQVGAGSANKKTLQGRAFLRTLSDTLPFGNSDLRIETLIEVDALDKAYFALAELHD